MSTTMQLVWEQGRGPVIVPALRVMVGVCLVMSVMLLLDRVYMGIVIAVIRVFGHKPEKKYKWEAMGEDVESGSLAYPMVLVQIPMYNEKEVRIEARSSFSRLVIMKTKPVRSSIDRLFSIAHDFPSIFENSKCFVTIAFYSSITYVFKEKAFFM